MYRIQQSILNVNIAHTIFVCKMQFRYFAQKAKVCCIFRTLAVKDIKRKKRKRAKRTSHKDVSKLYRRDRRPRLSVSAKI